MNDERFRLASITDHVGPRFPPTVLTSGNGDPLAPQAKRLAERLQACEVPVEALFFADDHQPALPHEYQFNLDISEGREAFERIVTFVERRANDRLFEMSGRSIPMPLHKPVTALVK